MTPDELTIVPPQRAEIGGSTVQRVHTLHTNATTDAELVSVWLRATATNSEKTERLYRRVGNRFIGELANAGVTLRTARLDDIQTALEAMATTEPRKKKDGTVTPGTAAKPATLNTYVAAVKSFLNLAHAVGFTPFNAAPLVRIKAAPRLLAQKIMEDVDITLLFRSARTERDRLMMRVAYYGGLRVSELVTLTWAKVIPRDSGEVQLVLVGKGSKERNVLLPATLATALASHRSGAQAADRVFPITDRRFNHIVKATAKRAGLNTAASAHWFRHAHASHALDRGAPISLVSQGLGHASIKTTSVYSHAKPNDSASRYLIKDAVIDKPDPELSGNGHGASDN